MKKKIALLLALILMLIPMTGAFALSSMEKEIRDELYKNINEFRESKGLKPYTVSPLLEEYAQEWAEHMQSIESLEHRKNLGEIMERDHMSAIRENIAYQFAPLYTAKQFADAMMNGWIHSPGHYKNLTAPGDDFHGLGVSYKNFVCYASHNMGQYYEEGPAPTPKPEPVIIPDKGEQGVPGLNYSSKPFEDEDKERAITGPGYIVNAAGYALNGATNVRVEPIPGTKKMEVYLEKDGERVHTKGFVEIYMKVPKGTPRPFRVKVDGKMTNFEFVPGTDYVVFGGKF